MQSSGVGNCINMLSLISACRFPFLTLRHDARRMGRVQSVAGADGRRHVEPCSAPTGVQVYRVDSADEVAETVAARRRTWPSTATLAVAVLLSQTTDRPQGVAK